MPEVISESGRKVGCTLCYGRMQFVEFSTMAGPDDVPILPGETYTFHISTEQREGWEKPVIAKELVPEVGLEPT